LKKNNDISLLDISSPVHNFKDVQTFSYVEKSSFSIVNETKMQAMKLTVASCEGIDHIKRIGQRGGGVEGSPHSSMLEARREESSRSKRGFADHLIHLYYFLALKRI
jgi:hypothetical protein